MRLIDLRNFAKKPGSSVRFIAPLCRIPLRLRLHYFRRYQDYVWMPRQGVQYAEDNLFTQNATPFLDDQNFQRAYQLGVQTKSWHGLSIRWRAYVACWAGLYASRLDGDFVECGVNRGGLARAMVDYIGFERLDKRFYLIDTFSGLVPAYLSEEEIRKGILQADIPITPIIL